MAHFMGVGGADEADPERRGQSERIRRADVSERGARPTSRSSTIASRRARSVSQVYSVLNTRYEAAANSPVTRTAMAAAPAAKSAEAV